MSQTVNLGQIAAIHIGLTPPSNRKLIWYDDNASQKIHKTFNVLTNKWETMAGGAMYVNNKPLQIQVGAAAPGTTFNGTVAAALDKILNASLPPGMSLQASNPQREMGAPTATVLSWYVQRNTEAITGIIVNGVAFAPTGESQSGTLAVQANPNVSTSWSGSVQAGTQSGGAGASVDFFNKYFMFANASDLMNADAATLSTLVRAAARQELDGNSRSRSRTDTFAGEYAYYAYKASYGAVSVVANGLANSGFLFKPFSFTNAFGFVETFLLVRSGEKLSGTHSVAYS
jgi:hypothetical protein